jgi:hypothetical protein
MMTPLKKGAARVSASAPNFGVHCRLGDHFR